jgi:hypothetical protein
MIRWPLTEWRFRRQSDVAHPAEGRIGKGNQAFVNPATIAGRKHIRGLDRSEVAYATGSMASPLRTLAFRALPRSTTHWRWAAPLPPRPSARNRARATLSQPMSRSVDNATVWYQVRSLPDANPLGGRQIEPVAGLDMKRRVPGVEITHDAVDPQGIRAVRI